MLSLLRTQTEQLKWTSKRKKSLVNSSEKRRMLAGLLPERRGTPTHYLFDCFKPWFLAFWNKFDLLCFGYELPYSRREEKAFSNSDSPKQKCLKSSDKKWQEPTSGENQWKVSPDCYLFGTSERGKAYLSAIGGTRASHSYLHFLRNRL